MWSDPNNILQVYQHLKEVGTDLKIYLMYQHVKEVGADFHILVSVPLLFSEVLNHPQDEIVMRMNAMC